MKDYTDITILLDRSGSMEAIKTAMESGFDEFLTQHRKVPSTRLSLVQFDGNNPYDVVYTAQPISDAPRLRIDPRGSTPLLDAACMAIDETGRRLANLAESERPARVLYVIITDGQENASVKHNRADLKQRVTRQSNDYKWQFVYLGANQDAIAEAATFGIARGKAMYFDVNRVDPSILALTSNTAAYASGGLTAVPDWSDLQRAEAVDDDKLDQKKLRSRKLTPTT